MTYWRDGTARQAMANGQHRGCLDTARGGIAVGVRQGGGASVNGRGRPTWLGVHPSRQGRRKKREGKDRHKGVGPYPVGPPRWGIDLETAFKTRVHSRVRAYTPLTWPQNCHVPLCWSPPCRQVTRGWILSNLNAVWTDWDTVEELSFVSIILGIWKSILLNVSLSIHCSQKKFLKFR
jgi:hypothetical protein